MGKKGQYERLTRGIKIGISILIMLDVLWGRLYTISFIRMNHNWDYIL